MIETTARAARAAMNRRQAQALPQISVQYPHNPQACSPCTIAMNGDG